MKALFILTLSSLFTFAIGEKIGVLYYNLLYYDQVTSFCTPVNNCRDLKDESLLKVLSYLRPSLFAASEVKPCEETHTHLKNYLNLNGFSFGRGRAVGSFIGNLLFYDTTLFKLRVQDALPTKPRVSDIYELLDIRSGMVLTVIVVHLKAGNSALDRDMRTAAAYVIEEYLQSLPLDSRVLLMGDLNLYGSSEEAYRVLTDLSHESLYLIDPLRSPGEWSGDSSFSWLHTQSTRVGAPCFAGGGMDDRFDFILGSPALFDSPDLYIEEGTYRAVGQDGLRFNRVINDPPNFSEPDSIIEALFNISDHLPVYLELSRANSSNVLINSCFNSSLFYLEDRYIRYSGENAVDLSVYSFSGRLVYRKGRAEKGFYLDMSIFAPGLYILNLSNAWVSSSFEIILY